MQEIARGGVLVAITLVMMFLLEGTPFSVGKMTDIAFFMTVTPELKYILYRIMFYAIVVLLSFGVICIAPFRRTIFTNIGQKTMQIYFWHIPLRSVIYYIGLNQMICVNDLGVVVWLIFAFVLMLFLTLPIFSFPTRQIIMYSKEKG